jgi:hypothetical protein
METELFNHIYIYSLESKICISWNPKIIEVVASKTGPVYDAQTTAC